MEKQIVAFTYMILQLAKQYAENVMSVNDKIIDLESYSLSYKLNYFNSNNDFSKSKCSLFPFLVTIANGDKDQLATFFEGFTPVEEGFVQIELRNSLNNKEYNIKNIFSFESKEIGEQLRISDQFINSYNSISIDNIISVLNLGALVKSSEIPYECIDYSIIHINDVLPYFPNRKYELLAYLSKDNTVYRKLSFLFEDNGDIKQEFKDIFKSVNIKDLLKSEILENNFPLTPLRSSTSNMTSKLVNTTETVVA